MTEQLPPKQAGEGLAASDKEQRNTVQGTTSALVMEHPDRYPAVLESIRTVKNKLSALNLEHGSKIFVMTGAGRGAGTSTLAFNLALVLARELADRRVLLVDAAVTRPSLHQVFRLPLEPGLLDCILDGQSLDRVVRSSSQPNLDLITVGRSEQPLHSPFDMLRFPQLLDQMRQIYDVVLFDTSAALHCSHCRIILPKADGVIVVAEANVTRWEVLAELKRRLDEDRVRLVGGIVNKRRYFIPKWVYRLI